MRIEHVAIWTTDLERLREFYECYFGAVAGSRYENPRKQFRILFPGIRRWCTVGVDAVHLWWFTAGPAGVAGGFAHLAVALGLRAAVDNLTAKLREDGHPVLDARGAPATVTTNRSFWTRWEPHRDHRMSRAVRDSSDAT